MDPECRGRLRQDSGFFCRTRIRTQSQNFVKNQTRVRSHFSITAVAGVYVSFGWIDDTSRSLNISRILKFENF